MTSGARTQRRNNGLISRSRFARPADARAEASAWNMRTPVRTMSSSGETVPTSI